MLIRSQDNKTLFNFTQCINIGEHGKGAVIYVNNLYPAGEYSTAEKALKVLDMIQEAYAEYKITCTFLTGFTGHRAIVESNDIRINGFEELVKSFKKNMVFQMPEDSEVEA